MILAFFLFVFSASTAWALDPVAPKSDRAFGFFKVETPQGSDSCELLRLSPAHPPYKTSCQAGTLMTVPVGEYHLMVKMQEYSWNEKIHIFPTEYTSVAVLGYGNLLVTSPHPADTIVVYDAQGKEVAQFKANAPKVIPTGTYNVMVKSSRSQTSMNQVSVVANKTRELVVSYQ